MSLHASAIFSSLDEVKPALRISGQSEEPDLERLINALTATFELVSSRKLKQRVLTDYRVDGNGYREISLPYVPASAVTKVDIRHPLNDAVYKTVTDTTKFVLKDPELGLLLMKEDTLIYGNRNVLVSFTAGFASDDIRWQLIKDLMLQQLSFSYRLVRNNEVGLVTKSYSDGSVSFFPPQRLLKEVRDGLTDIKDWRF